MGYDGRSIKNILVNGNNFNVNDEWRQILLFEYKTIKATESGIGISKCSSWDPSSSLPANGETASVSVDSQWTVDNMYNNWKVLRIKNDSVDWMYGEFVTVPGYVANDFEADLAENKLIWTEFYDLNIDPFQLNNIYDNGLSDDQRNILHSMLKTFGSCNGAQSCSPIGYQQNEQIGSSESDNSNNGQSTTTSIGSSPIIPSSGNKGNKNPRSGKAAYSEPIYYDKYNNDYNYNDPSQQTYTAVALVLCSAIIVCAALGVGMLIGQKLERQKHVGFVDKV